MTFSDPLVDSSSLPPAMVAAALSRPDGAVAVLAGTRLATWIQEQIADAVSATVRDARAAWQDEVSSLIADAADAANAASLTHFDALVAAVAGTRNTAPDDLNSGAKTRHNVLLPEATWQAVKATAATRGLSIQDALTEAAQAWVIAQHSTTNPTTDRKEA